MTIILLTVIFSMFNFTPAPAGLPVMTGFERSFGGASENFFMNNSVIGEISDSRCRFKHMDGMESDEKCVQHCRVGGAKTVLIDPAKNLVYTLDAEGEKEAAKFAAQRVRVTGHLMNTMIHVEKIEAAE